MANLATSAFHFLLPALFAFDFSAYGWFFVNLLPSPLRASRLLKLVHFATGSGLGGYLDGAKKGESKHTKNGYVGLDRDAIGLIIFR